MHVYTIANSVDGKIYIGKTVSGNLSSYLCRQIRTALAGDTNKPYLFNAIRKHGADKFSIFSLMTGTTNEELCRLERLMISLFDARNPSIGYNVALGGDGAPVGNQYRKGKKHSEATKALMRKSHEGVPFPMERRRNMSKARRQSYIARPEIRTAISASMLGNTNGRAR